MLHKGQIIKDDIPEKLYIKNSTTNKFSFIGEVLEIKKIDIIYKAVIAIGNNLTEVILTENDLKEISVGSKVLIASKAFNPIVKKIKE